MARRGNNNKPHLLSEATVRKFMKLSGLETHSSDFRKDMGYNNNTRDRYWEQPGLSQYRSRLHEEMEGNVSQDPDKAIGPGAQDQLSEEEEKAEGDAPEVEAVVDAIVDAIESATDMEVQAEPAKEDGDEEAAMMKREVMDKEQDEKGDEEAALKKMKEALSNRRTARRLVENVMRRAKAQARRR